MQSGFGFGTLLAALIWLFLQGTSPGAWRWMFVIGVAPAFLVLYIRRRLDESQRWRDAVRRRNRRTRSGSSPCAGSSPTR